MTAVSDSQIFRNIFSTAESAAIWSDSGEKPDELCVLYILTSSEGRTTNYLRFEASLAIAQAKLNIIPQKAADAIVEKCTIDLIDWNELRQQTELIGYAF
jgi:3-carboxy-cis,cis-muconate cycloisomerase